MIWWVDQPTSAKQKNPAAPYAPAQMDRAREHLRGLRSASPVSLSVEDGPEPWQYVLRRADLLDLFDTTPDLSGNEIDVSRFIRASEDKDAYLAWRDWDQGSAPSTSLPDLADEELCPVSLNDVREFLKSKREIYTWNFATEEWVSVERDRLYAGMLGVVRSDAGGYTPKEGWSPESRLRVEPLPPRKEGADADSHDFASFETYCQTLSGHTTRVIQEAQILAERCKLDLAHAQAMLTAAGKHDWGKAHKVFQSTLHRKSTSPELLAKVKGNAGPHERRYFRHELASALAMLATGESDLSTYLVAAHHGKIRLGIRSKSRESELEGLPVARGIHEGDILPGCALADGVSVPQVRLSLACMELGGDGGSWTDRMLQLRDDVGLFRLAYLEMVLRVADEEASKNPGSVGIECQ